MTALYLFRFLIKALVLSDGYRFAILFTELDDKERREFSDGAAWNLRFWRFGSPLQMLL